MGQMQTVGKTATIINVCDNITYVRYHNTDVVAFDDKGIALDTGGWWTATTKARMNQAANQFNLGYQVYQHKHEWFIQSLPFGESEPIPYNDSRITLLRTSDGGVCLDKN